MSDGWVGRLIDARLSAEEATLFERMVAKGVEQDVAITWLLMRRRSTPDQAEILGIPDAERTLKR